MTYLGTITSKRQLTLPVALFLKLGLVEGQRVVIGEEEGVIQIRPASFLVEELAGSLTPPKSLLAVDVDEAIRLGRERHFNEKYKSKRY
ncbi:MAG: hypothetical protein A2420_01210 [Candidatus Moranbacteria bacterium RIFOXYC1_FULL_44_13]|nr:MAG: hypothetical protein A2420_01210 [Candidatus Moranbacteria bacterium RIFOXYC1_FULL_44_13]